MIALPHRTITRKKIALRAGLRRREELKAPWMQKLENELTLGLDHKSHHLEAEMKTFKILSLFALVCIISAIAGSAEASFLDDTAGISASAQLSIVDLAMAENAFKSIENRDQVSIVGLVGLDGYDESHDVHVYVTSTGHLTAYYLNDEPASKVVDWVGHNGDVMTLKGSKLEDAMTKICEAVGQKLPRVTYFDFRYPAAQTIKLLVDKQTDVAHKKLKYTAPSTDTIFDASWSSAVHVADRQVRNDSVLCIDGNEMYRHVHPSVGWQIANANMDRDLFDGKTAHEMDLYNLDSNHRSYAAIVLVCSK